MGSSGFQVEEVGGGGNRWDETVFALVQLVAPAMISHVQVGHFNAERLSSGFVWRERIFFSMGRPRSVYCGHHFLVGVATLEYMAEAH